MRTKGTISVKWSVITQESSFPCLYGRSLDKENPRLGIGKEEEGDRKEGRELLDFLAGNQKQIVPEPGIVRGSVRTSPRRQTRNITGPDLAPYTVTQQKVVRKRDPGGCKRNINNHWVGTCGCL